VVTDEQWKGLVELCAWLPVWRRYDSDNIQPDSQEAVHERKLTIEAEVSGAKESKAA
jgi:hypothetical protein